MLDVGWQQVHLNCPADLRMGHGMRGVSNVHIGVQVQQGRCTIGWHHVHHIAREAMAATVMIIMMAEWTTEQLPALLFSTLDYLT